MAIPLLEEPGVYDIQFRQGTTWRKSFTWKQGNGTPVDLTGCTAAVDVRLTEFSATAVIELTTENGRIAIDGPAGKVTLSLTAAETAAIRALEYRYDLDIYDVDPTRKTTLMTGEFAITKEITT